MDITEMDEILELVEDVISSAYAVGSASTGAHFHDAAKLAMLLTKFKLNLLDISDDSDSRNSI